MNKFDNIDLGNDKTMNRLIKAENEKRNAILDEVITKLEELDYHIAVQHIKDMKLLK